MPMPSTDSPSGPAPGVSLREITADTLESYLRLAVAEDQRGFVASNAVSVAQAHFSREAWFRGIVAGDEPVGFLMLHDDPEKAEYFLWRLMIDQNHQGKGYGKAAVALLVDHVRTRPNATSLGVSTVRKPGNPQPFYEALGFVATGEIEDGETVLRLAL